MSVLEHRQLGRALDLVQKIYEAAAESALWPAFLNAFAEATGNESTVIWMHDTADASARFDEPTAAFVSNVRMEPSYLRSYTEYYTHRNILVSGIDAAPEGAALTSSGLLSEAAFHRTEYYNDWLRPQGIGYCMGGPVLKRGREVAVFSTSRLLDAGAFPEEDVLLTRLLMPHLRRACLLHQRLVRLRAAASGLIQALNQLPTAVFLLSETGTVIHANRAAHELSARRDGLWIARQGQLVATDPAERLVLRRLVMSAIAARQGKSVEVDSAMRIRRTSHDVPLHVMVYPLAQGSTSLDRCTAALFAFDPTKERRAGASLLRTVYGLTPSEARLVEAVARGESLKDYCSTADVTLNTARTHLKHAFSKTGTHRQSELIALLHRLDTQSGGR